LTGFSLSGVLREMCDKMAVAPDDMVELRNPSDEILDTGAYRSVEEGREVTRAH